MLLERYQDSCSELNTCLLFILFVSIDRGPRTSVCRFQQLFYCKIIKINNGRFQSSVENNKSDRAVLVTIEKVALFVITMAAYIQLDPSVT